MPTHALPRFRVQDLSHPITADMPVYPGTEPPVLAQGTTIAEHGFAERRITFFSHTGTHLDAPCHILEGAPALDDLAARRFVGPACVLDARGLAVVTREHLEPLAETLRGCAFLLLRTGWEAHWGTPRYFEGFPCLSPGAAQWLGAQGLSGVGVDAISVDPVDSSALPVHRALLGAGLVLVENLCNLGALPEKDFLFSALPLPLAGGDGSPVRAVALVPDA